jgi:hypothetical protein
MGALQHLPSMQSNHSQGGEAVELNEDTPVLLSVKAKCLEERIARARRAATALHDALSGGPVPAATVQATLMLVESLLSPPEEA